MAERAEPAVPGAPTGGPAAPPRIAPWLLVYTVGRLAIAAALVVLLWVLGLDFWSGALFGLLCRCRCRTCCCALRASG